MHNPSSWLEINNSAFKHTITTLTHISGTPLMAVIKSHAYGHGLYEIAYLAELNDSIAWLCTATISEALFLRSKSITKPLLVLAHWDESPEAAVENNITLSLTDLSQLSLIELAVAKIKKPYSMHIKIDTGMSRLGISITQAHTLLTSYYHPLISFSGIFTHLFNKDATHIVHLQEQLTIFNDFKNYREHTTQKRYITHALSSGSLDFASQFPFTYTRIGTHIYGFTTSPISHQRLIEQFPEYYLQPILTWKTRILSIKHIMPGTCVGYGCTFKASQKMKIAILPVGYADGYPRQLSHKSSVMIHGTLVPVIGLISMNLIIIDITNIEYAALNDEVILMGDYTGIRACDISHILGTIPIEITTRINPALKRIIV